MNKTNRNNSPKNQPKDLRAELEAMLMRNPHLDDPDYRRLPAPDPQHEDVFAHNDQTFTPAGHWHVNVQPSFEDADADEVEALAAALATAARQARIMNGPVVLEVVALYDGGVTVGDRVRLIRMVSPAGRTEYRLTPYLADDHMHREPVGYSWGSDGFECEYMGAFTIFSAETREGHEHTLLTTEEVAS